MPDDVAVLDAPAAADVVTDDTSVDLDEGADASGAPEGTGDEDTGAPAAGDDAAAAAAASESGLIVDGKRLSPAAKATLEEIKAKDPKLAAQIKSALFSADALRRAVPGGLKEVGQLRQTIEDLGGTEGIEALRTEREEWNALDQQFIKADPNFVESIAGSNPASFLKLAPVVFQKFAQLNPEGHSAYVSQIFVADMQQEGIPLALERMQDFIGDNPKAMEVWKRLAAYVNRVGGFAQKPVAARGPQPANGDDRDRQLAEREANLLRSEWRGVADGERMSVFNTEYARLVAGRKVSDTQKAAIQELYVSRLGAALRKSPNFNQNIDRYFGNKDRAGYLRFIGSIYKQEIPRALRSAIESVLPAKPGPASKGGAPAAGGAPAVPAKPASGYTWSATPPPKDKIDVNRTTMDMIREGRAVLVDGKKVQWKR